jgi:glycosyltransferase involved in cell wall biosynthesis
VRIAFIGQKGIPARFGGIEVHVDALARKLAARGIEVGVYVRDWYTPKTVAEHGRARLIHVPTIRDKHLDASVHGLLCSLHAAGSGVDLVHYHGIGPSAFAPIPKLCGKKVVATIHRLDWQTEKWGRFAKAMLRLGERIAVRVPDRTIVVSEDLGAYVRATYGRTPIFLPNGFELPNPLPADLIAKRYGLEKNGYVLFLGRLVPEKRVDWLLRAFADPRIGSVAPGGRRFRLVIAGGSSATDGYVDRLWRDGAGRSDVLFTGAVWGREKEELLANARLVVLPSSLEGYPIVLLEAKSYGICCLASDIAPHREVIRDGRDGLLFDASRFDDFAAKLRSALDDPGRLDRLGCAARDELRTRPDWDAIAERTLDVYRELLASRPSSRNPRDGGR